MNHRPEYFLAQILLYFNSQTSLNSSTISIPSLAFSVTWDEDIRLVIPYFFSAIGRRTIAYEIEFHAVVRTYLLVQIFLSLSRTEFQGGATSYNQVPFQSAPVVFDLFSSPGNGKAASPPLTSPSTASPAPSRSIASTRCRHDSPWFPKPLPPPLPSSKSDWCPPWPRACCSIPSAIEFVIPVKNSWILACNWFRIVN